MLRIKGILPECLANGGFRDGIGFPLEKALEREMGQRGGTIAGIGLSYRRWFKHFGVRAALGDSYLPVSAAIANTQTTGQARKRCTGCLAWT